MNDTAVAGSSFNGSIVQQFNADRRTFISSNGSNRNLDDWNFWNNGNVHWHGPLTLNV